jgi:hypothetical protein
MRGLACAALGAALLGLAACASGEPSTQQAPSLPASPSVSPPAQSTTQGLSRAETCALHMAAVNERSESIIAAMSTVNGGTAGEDLRKVMADLDAVFLQAWLAAQELVRQTSDAEQKELLTSLSAGYAEVRGNLSVPIGDASELAMKTVFLDSLIKPDGKLGRMCE